ncbi:MAG TPA: phosphatidate cytidylyltransferase, partial [Solirubrobacterales bacterium]|nr:phosphatidate cytidylyltransferase [Solirubrobacterales bacterium]
EPAAGRSASQERAARRKRGSGGRGGDRKPARQRTGETAKRVAFALPWIAFAIAIVVAGGPIFALAMVGIGALCLREFFAVVGLNLPARVPAYLAIAGLVTAAYFGDSFQVLLVFIATMPLLFAFGLSRESGGLFSALTIGIFAVAWIGLPLAHAVFLRELPLHGAALLINVLVGTFVSDTAAYVTGRMFGHRRIFPRISPNKTLEGLIGGFLIGALSVWFAGLYQDWLSGTDALLMGLAIAATAPIGDLFESAIKRDLKVKDTGRIFGPHGGILDRLDAILFTVVVGYYISLTLVY